MAHYRDRGAGYSKQQSTRPQTLGYGLVDSPAGQCAWIVEKFWAWTDCDGASRERRSRRDELLDNVMLYWLPGTGASLGPALLGELRRRERDPVTVPAGCSIFPKEIFRPSRRWAEPRFTDLRYWNELDRGGHFAAFEQPADCSSARCGPPSARPLAPGARASAAGPGDLLPRRPNGTGRTRVPQPVSGSAEIEALGLGCQRLPGDLSGGHVSADNLEGPVLGSVRPSAKYLCVIAVARCGCGTACVSVGRRPYADT